MHLKIANYLDNGFIGLYAFVSSENWKDLILFPVFYVCMYVCMYVCYMYIL
jgi:hypothetical protein